MTNDVKTVWVFNQDVVPYGAGDRELNRKQAIEKALKLSVAEVVPFFVAESKSGHVAVGRIGFVDSDEYPTCVGLAFEGKFISSL